MNSIKWHGMRLMVAIKQEWLTLLNITFGCVILTIGIMGLTVPYKLPDSGLTGLAVLAKYAFGLSPAWIIGLGNVALLWWSWKELSPRFVVLTAYGVTLLTVLIRLADNLPHPTIHDTLLVAILAGVIKGIGGGIVFRCGASLGGTDIIVMVLRKRLGVEVGKYSFYINLFILALSSAVVGIEGALFGLVSVYANGVVTDNVLSSFDRRRLVFIVSREHKAITQYIIQEMNRGVTELMGKGGYSGEDRPTLMCLLTPKQAMDLKRFVAQLDPKAFMVISEASEVLGRGFKTWKQL
ncbi:hypothetical protein TheveDRAFT_1274 [Thermanaerovibrio velox DSM 12556]|uniref:DUF2179 domain-containing protein n=1 Tax=Thermanaerovibrio velox DSM 12556 TaxID=926567 RepID=H0UNA9_9BACT|nr:YitT family protein [Thermanaerovibrio velox]EHM10394.1 hypothetical protein TheveDRAFT_1274 [Thermanaerovibrio velox DSM 12556]